MAQKSKGQKLRTERYVTYPVKICNTVTT